MTNENGGSPANEVAESYRGRNRDHEQTALNDSNDRDENRAAPDPEKQADDLEKQVDGPRDEEKPALSDQTNLLPKKQLITVFLALSAATTLAFLDQTIVATALPTISSEFNAGKLSSWVATSYLLSATAMQPIYGRLSDIIGRKLTLVAGLVTFIIASLGCALSQTMIQLVVFRAWQGVGGGSILTLVLVIVGDVVSLKDRGKYAGIIEAVIAASNGIGPTIGGVLTSKVSWRWCFWINLPIGVICVIFMWLYLPQRRIEGNAMVKLKRIDYLGSILTVAFSVLLLLPLNWGGVTFPWNSAAVISTFVVGILLTLAFLLWEWRGASYPVVPMHIFRYPTVVGVYIATTFNGWVYYCQLFYIPQLFQVSRGYSALKSGYLTLPLFCTPSLSVFLCGLAVSRGLDYRIPIYVGFALSTVGNGLLASIGSHTPVANIIGFEILTGAGMGCTFQTTLIAAQAATPRQDMGVVTSLRGFVRSVGAVIGLAMATTILNATLQSELSSFSRVQINAILDDPPAIWRPGSLGFTPDQQAQVVQAYVEGFGRLFYTLTGLCGGSLLACVLLVGRHSLVRNDEAKLREEAKERVKADKEAKKQKTAPTTSQRPNQTAPPR